MSHIRQAFETICNEATESTNWYVSLVEKISYYGGPEEGGWWGNDIELIAFQQYPSEELANAAAEKIKTLAEELTTQAQAEYGQHCLDSMEWLEARGLDADFLPEPDGPSEYSVRVTEGEPAQPSRGCRQYS